MKHIKLFENSEKTKLIKTLYNEDIEIKLGDWVEYFYSQFDYFLNKELYHNEIGEIFYMEKEYLDFDILVKPKSDNRLPERWIRSVDIYRKLEDFEVDSKKFNL